MDRISVLIPTYNRNSLLREALESLQTQTFSDWEAIIVDNSGNETARSVVDHFQDYRLVYVPCSRNLGECGGRNLAFSYSSGNYICYLDDDDLLPADSLQCRIDFYRRHPDSGMIYADFQRFQDIHGTRVLLKENANLPHMRKCYYDHLLERLDYNQKDTFYFLKKFNFVRGGTPLMHRSTLEAVGLFDESLVSYGNYEMWLRIAAQFPIRFLRKVVYYYRQHEGSVLRRTERQVAIRCAQRICERYDIQSSLQFACVMMS